MQSCLGSQCARRCAAVTAALAGSYPVLARAYSVPTYTVNSSTLSDQRGHKPDSSSSISTSKAHHKGEDGDSSSDSERFPAFTQLDLKNPPQMPSPTSYATYEEYLDAYDHYLKDTDRFTAAARVFVQTRFQKLRAMQASMAHVVRREYLWTFAPMLFCLAVFIVDRSNHSAAAFTHRVIKERTKLQVKHVKWESL
ncbi:hypothetical protein ABB37_04780 [Leptomonas pyrrhocoris]|uniref:Uncharacterized protein n=1 Tax=Leptomonas pyrrhocoris TaxID=157538 RepID=A0A0M9G1N7_LEPPY|nr:hypothetical protein ABB37_04780 [Leptomonas pyrrhocoris]KPA80580.1 hypothetical protein ABB37_04780 [Leptomonas pyrrhocoris]|eukprot:XP_015659019.1 hypothetical protein ABB37_04780 [Leptomonas pyrrhocoris]